MALIFLTQCGECEHCIEGRPSLCARGTQANHAELAERLTPFSTTPMPPMWDPSTVQGLAALNAEVTRQAAAIGYANDFWLMMVLTLCAMPLVLLMHSGRHEGNGASASEAAAAAH